MRRDSDGTLLLCCRGRRGYNGGTRNDRSGRRSARDRRTRRGSYDIRLLAWQRNNLARTGNRSRRCNRRRRSCRRGTWCHRRYNRSRRSLCRRRRSHNRRTSHDRRGCPCRSLGLLALQNRLQRIAGLGDLRQVKPGLRLRCLLRSAARPASTGNVRADLVRLVELNGARVGLLFRDANRRESVQNGLALYFQFACQIVDSNFAHPSLFASLAPLAAHIGLFEVGIVISIISETEAFAISRTPYGAASHGRVHRQCLRLRPLAPHPPACQLCRCPARSAPREHLHR